MYEGIAYWCNGYWRDSLVAIQGIADRIGRKVYLAIDGRPNDALVVYDPGYAGGGTYACAA